MGYTLTFTLNEQDFLEFNRYHMYNTPVIRKRLLIFRFGMPIMFMVLALIYGGLLGSQAVSMSVFGILSLAWILFFRRYYDRVMRKSLLRLKKSGKLHYDKEITLTFEEEYFFEKTPDSESKINYTMIERVASGKHAIYLYRGALMACVIPRRAFADEKAYGEFTSFVNSKVQKQNN